MSVVRVKLRGRIVAMVQELLRGGEDVVSLLIDEAASPGLIAALRAMPRSVLLWDIEQDDPSTIPARYKRHSWSDNDADIQRAVRARAVVVEPEP